MEQHTITGTTTDSEGNVHNLLEANYGTRGAGAWEKWYVCGICGLEFPRSGVVMVKGVAYCHKYGHSDPKERKG